jgi:phosphomevalonate kinase
MPKTREAEPDYDAWTVEDLDAELRRLDEARLAARGEARTVREARDRKLAAQHAARLADTLSDDQKAALAQHLALSGAGGGKAGAGGAR